MARKKRRNRPQKEGDESAQGAGEKRKRTSQDVEELETAAPPRGIGGSYSSSRERTPAFPSDGRYRNKQRCLVLCSRGVTARYRHLLEDLRTLIPHHKKESKLDPGNGGRGGTGGGLGRAVNDVADVRGCNSVLFLECRKRRDCYLWVGRTAGRGAGAVTAADTNEDSTNPLAGGAVGPSVKFHLTNVHTMDELRLTGNCMKGSRPVLSFDSAFAERDDLRLIKSLFVDVFGTPRGHPKSKPFVDRVMAFYWADGKIWVRNYQIVRAAPEDALEAHIAKKAHADGDTRTTSLVEIGPRFVLDPVRIFRGSFGGQTLYMNDEFVSPNEVRAQEQAVKGNVFEERLRQKKRKKTRKAEMEERMPDDPLAGVFS
mmetsp:Transcript_38771/g.116523  ORF Transcript_38771/g.116523 Transcript_38771/m.116523 type:complete len:371 (-) Transcript_38771:146-1258(-)|eukprot:CAMPEP_0113572518 /NCGR_PEP_ID=MMETSP0015_2-20120614/26133_1 /TAXON_ID=2838 /ORGANISM="Odontella" /LENGTH=370 /DNA_ID=CAMNT_0000475547 /DNA_START=93 /DNA_END=1205 /DNA_ORIENTATION=+ /assembly_acc=CAM_ASM_000160